MRPSLPGRAGKLRAGQPSGTAGSQLNLKNNEINNKAAKNALLPTLDLVGFYGSNGLGANYGDVFTALVNRSGPDKGAYVSLSIPLRNRAAQANQIRSELEYGQSQLLLQQQKNQIILQVRNAAFALEQARAGVESARAAATTPSRAWTPNRRSLPWRFRPATWCCSSRATPSRRLPTTSRRCQPTKKPGSRWINTRRPFWIAWRLDGRCGQRPCSSHPGYSGAAADPGAIPGAAAGSRISPGLPRSASPGAGNRLGSILEPAILELTILGPAISNYRRASATPAEAVPAILHGNFTLAPRASANNIESFLPSRYKECEINPKLYSATPADQS